MKIEIIENGCFEELTIIDPITGCDYISDLMGNHGELPEYCDDNDVYLMGQECFDWWLDLTTRLQDAEYRYYELRKEIDDGCKLDDAKNEFTGNCDLENLPALINLFCDHVAS